MMERHTGTDKPEDISASLAMGMWAERNWDGPSIKEGELTREQINWVGAWLAGDSIRTLDVAELEHLMVTKNPGLKEWGKRFFSAGGATEEQIEAAARAIYHDQKARYGDEITAGIGQPCWRYMARAALSASASADPADEHHDAEERQAESEDHAAAVTGDREKLIEQLRDWADRDWRFMHNNYARTLRQAAAALAAPVEVDESTEVPGYLTELIGELRTAPIEGHAWRRLLGRAADAIEKLAAK